MALLFGRKETEEWCCLGFEAGYNNAGNRGHSYLIGRNSLGGPDFISQYRAVALGDEMFFDSKVMASIVVETCINFCPTCGTDLMKWYGDRVDELQRDDLEIGILKNGKTLTTISPHPTEID